MSVRIVGVRHHSPACARAVAHVLDEVKPRWVLIEGPSDMNGRIGELVDLGHRLPIALYHFVSGDGLHAGSFTPFCDTSPEWTALQWAKDNGAETRFIDLPSWAKAFYHCENRTADRVDRYGQVARRLSERLGMDGSDAVWDHLFEQEDSPDALLERLDRYFAELRPDDADAPEKDLDREAFMAACIAWAAAQGSVVVVCGGFHKPALDRRWPTLPAVWPDEPPRDPSDRTGTYVVPWSDKRLDSFAGYAAGMPSPGWYSALQRSGHHAGPRQMLNRAIDRLREVKHPVSAADRVAVEVQLAGLVALRGHRSPTRSDVLDALCSGLIKDALDVPPPWTERVGVRAGSDARLVAVLDAFRGRAVGFVDPRAPRPPLVGDVHTLLAAHDLQLAEPPGRTVALDLFDEADLVRSRILHRLRVLQVPRVRRESGPDDPSSPDRREQWLLSEGADTLPALLEASIWGGTLEDAALNRMLHRIGESNGLSELVAVLVDVLFTGLGEGAPDLLSAVHAAVQREHTLEALGQALRMLVDLWRHETVFVRAHSDVVGGLLQSLFRRAIWVFEDLAGAASAGRLTAAVALREMLRHGPVDPSDRKAALAVFQRRSSDPAAPPDLRGASSGLRACFGEDIEESTVRSIRGVVPHQLGDWLAGLFAVTRETLHEQPAVLDALHDRIGGLSHPEFLVALPALRLAFSWFPPRERETVAAALLVRMGLAPENAWTLIETVEEAGLLAGARLEQDVEAVLGRYHLLQEGL